MPFLPNTFSPPNPDGLGRGFLLTPCDSSGGPGDDCDDNVGAFDLARLLGAWGPCLDPDDCPADLNADGSADLAQLLASWGPL